MPDQQKSRDHVRLRYGFSGIPIGFLEAFLEDPVGQLRYDSEEPSRPHPLTDAHTAASRDNLADQAGQRHLGEQPARSRR